MGRHSAPETDEERPEPSASPSAASPSAASAPVVASAPAAPSAAVPTAAASGTRGDLQLLRSDTGLLLRCAGAVVLIFLVHTSVLILIGRTDVYLIWLWIPAVLSGMVIGGLLDRAHRRSAERDRPAP